MLCGQSPRFHDDVDELKKTDMRGRKFLTLCLNTLQTNVTDMFTNTKYTKNIEHGTTRNEIHRITDGVMGTGKMTYRLLSL